MLTRVVGAAIDAVRNGITVRIGVGCAASTRAWFRFFRVGRAEVGCYTVLSSLGPRRGSEGTFGTCHRDNRLVMDSNDLYIVVEGIMCIMRKGNVPTIGRPHRVVLFMREARELLRFTGSKRIDVEIDGGTTLKGEDDLSAVWRPVCATIR
jgi:hypothetical protein